MTDKAALYSCFKQAVIFMTCKRDLTLKPLTAKALAKMDAALLDHNEEGQGRFSRALRDYIHEYKDAPKECANVIGRIESAADVWGAEFALNKISDTFPMIMVGVCATRYHYGPDRLYGKRFISLYKALYVLRGAMCVKGMYDALAVGDGEAFVSMRLGFFRYYDPEAPQDFDAWKKVFDAAKNHNVILALSMAEDFVGADGPFAKRAQREGIDLGREALSGSVDDENKDFLLKVHGIYTHFDFCADKQDLSIWETLCEYIYERDPLTALALVKDAISSPRASGETRESIQNLGLVLSKSVMKKALAAKDEKTFHAAHPYFIFCCSAKDVPNIQFWEAIVLSGLNVWGALSAVRAARTAYSDVVSNSLLGQSACAKGHMFSDLAARNALSAGDEAAFDKAHDDFLYFRNPKDKKDCDDWARLFSDVLEHNDGLALKMAKKAAKAPFAKDSPLADLAKDAKALALATIAARSVVAVGSLSRFGIDPRRTYNALKCAHGLT